MSTKPPSRIIRHFFTVDVEEYFHANALESTVSRDQWDDLPCRAADTLPLLLESLARHGATGTFFVLGWLAQRNPGLVREIAEAGHEIASHGFWHKRVTTLSAAEFREDVRASKRTLEDIVGRAVEGYRAPSFSIVPGTEWAFDVLLEEGFRYDSSLFPIRRPGYGYAGAPRDPHEIRRAQGTLAEYPLATTVLAGLTLPAAGGGYLRQLPLGLIRRAFREASDRGASATFYIHPWDIDPGQPRLPVGPVTRVRHYRGLGRALERVQRLLAEFPFQSIASGRAVPGHQESFPAPADAPR